MAVSFMPTFSAGPEVSFEDHRPCRRSQNFCGPHCLRSATYPGHLRRCNPWSCCNVRSVALHSRCDSGKRSDALDDHIVGSLADRHYGLGGKGVWHPCTEQQTVSVQGFRTSTCSTSLNTELAEEYTRLTKAAEPKAKPRIPPI